MDEVIARQNRRLQTGIFQKNCNAAQGREQHRKKYVISNDSGVLVRNGKKTNFLELELILHDLAGET